MAPGGRVHIYMSALPQSMQGGGGNDLKKQTEYKVVDGKFRKVIDGVIDYDWQGF